MKKRIKILLGALALLCVLILLLPFPTRVKKQFYATDTYSQKRADISVDITLFQYLLRKDKMKGNITVTTEDDTKVYESDSLYYAGKWHSNNKDEFVHAFVGFYMNDETYQKDYGEGVEGSQIIGMEAVNVFMSPGFEQLVLYHRQSEKLESPETWQFVGNVETGKSIETREYFKGYLKD